MILILGGTTEGRIAIQTLEEAGKTFYYSTRGDEQEVSLQHGIRLQGGMDDVELARFCCEQGIRLLIDAAHPFASLLHRTVAETARHLELPVIRLERIYPPRDEEHITWCRDYDDAIRQIKEQDIFSLLALTGVQSIGRLKALWQECTCCYFRILDRDSSRRLAAQAGFPEKYLYYYHEGEDDRLLMGRLKPEAILLKESGESGGFPGKVAAARELGIRIFAIRRPDMPDGFHTVNGPHGLRRQVERLLPEFFDLHTGLTTGTCATAASVAALSDLFCNDRPRPKEFPVRLPNGETITVPVQPRRALSRFSATDEGYTIESSASVIKESGDDPDITNGMTITAHIAAFIRQGDPDGQENRERKDWNITLRAGEGVGTVTLPGLGLEIGGPAINKGPRRMIEENIALFLQDLPVAPRDASFVVTLSVPGGAEIARRTFNPRLGVEGGISIIGTSGIIKPFSLDAFVSSIRKSMEVACATGSPRIVINSGAKSEGFLRDLYPALPAQAFVHYGNFIGETLKIAASLKVPRLTLGVMIGKAVKLAEGNLDTHSKHVTLNHKFIAGLAHEAGCSADSVAAIETIRMARELWELLPPDELPRFCRQLIRACRRHSLPLFPEGELTVVLISEKGEIYQD